MEGGVEMKKLVRLFFALIMAVGAFFLFYFLFLFLQRTKLIGGLPGIFSYEGASVLYAIIIGCIIGLGVYFFFSKRVVNAIFHQMDNIEEKLNNMSLKEIVISISGVIVGLVIGNLIGIALLPFGIIGTFLIIILNIVFGYLGFRVAKRKKDDILNIGFRSARGNTKHHIMGKPKILDTSVIIDGRILDILKTGFVEGKIIIPQFVLGELRHIADSSDSLKRNRGRRGLDILNEIQKQLKVPVEIVDKDFDTIKEVDSKLLKLAEEINATVVTNDFNLNKVADFKGVEVFNINELANAIKPIVLPGEDMTVTVIKDGKEHEQGIAYLNDGTMIVVEGGRKAIGQTIDVLVTSVLQTAAGRMIFTKMK